MTRTIPLDMNGTITIDAAKGFDAFAWPGGYDIGYYTDSYDVLCAECATEQERANNEPDAIVCHGEHIVGATIFEGSAIDHGIVHCANCNDPLVELDTDWEWECADCGQVNDTASRSAGADHNSDPQCTSCKGTNHAG